MCTVIFQGVQNDLVQKCQSLRCARSFIKECKKVWYKMVILLRCAQTFFKVRKVIVYGVHSCNADDSQKPAFISWVPKHIALVFSAEACVLVKHVSSPMETTPNGLLMLQRPFRGPAFAASGDHSIMDVYSKHTAQTLHTAWVTLFTSLPGSYKQAGCLDES